MTWIFYAFLPPAIWAITSLLDKILKDKHIPSSIGLTFMGTIYYVVFTLIVFAFHGLEIYSTKYLLIGILAGIVGTVSALPYYKGLGYDEASKVAIIGQFHPIFVLLLALIFLHESLSVYQYLAFILILLGGLLISVKKLDQKIQISKAFCWIILACFIGAIEVILDKYVLDVQGYWNALILFSFGAIIALSIMLVFSQVRSSVAQTFQKLTRKSIAIFLIADTLGVGGFLIYLYAIKLGPVSLVNVIGNTHVFFVFIYALIISLWLPKILKEEIDKKTLVLKSIAIILMFAGTYFLTI